MCVALSASHTQRRPSTSNLHKISCLLPISLILSAADRHQRGREFRRARAQQNHNERRHRATCMWSVCLSRHRRRSEVYFKSIKVSGANGCLLVIFGVKPLCGSGWFVCCLQQANMQSTVCASNCVSPESTVTSLLSSSGHLKSSLLSAEPSTPFRYRDKDYDSASAALDAYIADFDRSQNSSRFLTGRMVLPQSSLSTQSRHSARTLRNKDVLQESLTESELDFLKLPVSSLHHRSNRERLSMTTDELLSIPHDGSMPVTHTSALIQGLLSQSQLPPAARAGVGSHASFRLSHQRSHLTNNSRSSRDQKGAMLRSDLSFVSSLTCANRAAGIEGPEPSSLLHLPRWFTGHKEDIDCSGITSVPDLEYPAWIQHCPRSEPSEPEQWEHPAPRAGAPSWVAELEEEEPREQTPSLVDSQRTLKDLRLQFAEQISLLAMERKSSDMVDALFRDNRLEFLIQRADDVLRSLSRCSGGADGPADPAKRAGDGAEKMEQSRVSACRASSWSLDSAAAPGGAAEAASDTAQDCSSADEGEAWKQPGPLEALKQMMFRLQALEAELQRQQTACAAGSEGPRADQTPVKQKPEKEPERRSSPSGPSLQRALLHLKRLKQLVEEPQDKHLGQEKDLDECPSSPISLPAEGGARSQQDPH